MQPSIKPFIHCGRFRPATHPLGGFPGRALLQNGFLETRSWENDDTTPATGRSGRMLRDDCSAKLDFCVSRELKIVLPGESE
jgi:hypothetical protein